MNPKPATRLACLTRGPLTRTWPTTMACSHSRPRAWLDKKGPHVSEAVAGKGKAAAWAHRRWVDRQNRGHQHDLRLSPSWLRYDGGVRSTGGGSPIGMAARRWQTAVLRSSPVTKTARKRGKRTSEHRRRKWGTPKGRWFDGEAGPRAPYHGGAQVTPVSSTFRLGYDGIRHSILGGCTITDGALHACTGEGRDGQDEASHGGLPLAAMAGTASARRTRGPFGSPGRFPAVTSNHEHLHGLRKWGRGQRRKRVTEVSWPWWTMTAAMLRWTPSGNKPVMRPYLHAMGSSKR
jgi:hypothetical protein